MTGSAPRVSNSPARRLASPLVALATIVTIVAAAVAAFLNPIWVDFEQARTGVPAITGYTPDQVRDVSSRVLGEFLVGPGTFRMTVNGQPVFNPREQGHLADVRTVLIGLAVLAVASIVVLVAAARSSRPRAWVWQAVALGSGVLTAAVVVAGVAFALFFQAAFELFHRLFFSAGSYTFDPASERLVQLFPLQFWSETSIALSIVLLALALGVLAVALRRLPARDADATESDGLAAMTARFR